LGDLEGWNALLSSIQCVTNINRMTWGGSYYGVVKALILFKP